MKSAALACIRVTLALARGAPSLAAEGRERTRRQQGLHAHGIGRLNVRLVTERGRHAARRTPPAPVLGP